MTTRITLTILLTTWVVLLLGEAGAFYTARQSLLALFDYNIINRAMSALETELAGSKPSLQAGDSYHRAEPVANLLGAGQPTVTLIDTPGAQFTRDADGDRRRVLHLLLRVTTPSGNPATYTVSFGRTTDRLNQLLAHLAATLLLISLACGIVTAWVALKLSRAALRPLRETSDIIARIDERQLGTRIDSSKMPIELEPMAKRLNEMLSRLQHVFQQRKQFLADAAHELRTPTASLLTTLEVATRRPRDHAALLETLKSGLGDARRLRRLVESLMEQARSDVERPRPFLEQDVAAMVRECVQIVTPLANEKDVSISIAPEFPAQLAFVTQPERFRSVALNLLSNAIEYNRAGGSVSVRMERDDGGVLRLAVRDSGIGIAPEQLPHVFEPFYRGGAAGDDAQHLGLGLFLVRSHVQALCGECRVESTLGQGTTVHVTLPEPAEHHAARAAQREESVAVAAGSRIT